MKDRRKKNLSTNARRPLPPSRFDPTRTTSLRRAFVARLRRQFAKLRAAVYRLVAVEDALGLRKAMTYNHIVKLPSGKYRLLSHEGKNLGTFDSHEEAAKHEGEVEYFKHVGNAFCPTGEGGGVDPTCSPSGNDSAFGTDDPYVYHVTGKNVPLKSFLKGIVPSKVGYDGQAVYMSNKEETTYQNTGVGEGRMMRIRKDALIKKFGKYPQSPHGVQFDDMTGDVTLHGGKSIPADMIEVRVNGQFKKLLDVRGITRNERWRFHTTDEQLKAFQEWLKQQTDLYIKGMTEEELWNKYIQEGFKKGAGRAFDDADKQVGWTPEEAAFYAGSKDQFLRSAFGQPESLEKVKLLAARTFEELNAMTDDMRNKLGRVLTQGLIQGDGPVAIAREMTKQMDLSRARAETIARTELIRAHAEGQLVGLEEMGVEEVGVMVEWSTAQDDRVCDLCEPMEGVVLKIEEARGMIPRHPNCRCAFVPANVAEPTDDQKRTQGKIRKAVKLSAELGKDDFSTAVPVSKKRPEPVLPVITNKIELFSRMLVNSFCPTGPGGGVDPTCSPENSNTVGYSAEVYHGTKAAELPKTLIPSAYGKSRDAGNLGSGVYMTPDYSIAKFYASHDSSKVIKVKVHLKNPITIEGKKNEAVQEASKKLGVVRLPEYDGSMQTSHDWAEEFTRKAKMAGHDGVVWKDSKGRVTEVVSFDPVTTNTAVFITNDSFLGDDAWSS